MGEEGPTENEIGCLFVCLLEIGFPEYFSSASGMVRSLGFCHIRKLGKH